MERCRARFLKQRLKDPVQDARMNCARVEGHGGRHWNLDKDLYWSSSLEVDVADLLAEDTR